MKPILTFICMVAATFSAGAEVYHVAKTGSDTQPGTREEPIFTIQSAANIAQAGDTVIVHEGVYRETVTPRHSGNSDAPIIFKAAPGEHVVVNGADTLSADWEIFRDGIYRSNVSSEFNQLFVDGLMMNEARWPNVEVDALVMMPRAEADAGSNRYKLVDRYLPDGDWNGATVHITPGGEWVSFTRSVTKYKAGRRLFFDRPIDAGDLTEHVTPEPGSDYYLFGALVALDIPSEWWLDSETGTLYLWLPDGESPDKHAVEIKQRNVAFDLNRTSHITVRGFTIFSAAVVARDANGIIIEDCGFKYSHHATEAEGYALDSNGTNIISGSRNIVRNCVISHVAGEGLRIRGNNNQVVNNIIHDVNYLAGHYAAISIEGRGHIISRNTLYNSGRSLLMHYYAEGCTITYNDMYGGGFLTDDCGAVYCWNTDGDGTEIAYNWFHDMHGTRNQWTVGIYLDDRSKNHIVHHNVVWNTPFAALYIKETNEAYNNTLLASPNGVSIEARADVSHAIIHNNLCSGDLNLGAAQSKNNGDFAIDRQFIPTRSSGAIDGGREVPPYTDGFNGVAPDIGAYEFGDTYWSPGAKNVRQE